MDDLQSGQFHVPADGRLWWSDELYAVLGMSPGDVPPTIDALLRHVRVDEREALRQAIEECARDGVAFAQVHTVKRLEGETRVMAVAAVAEPAAQGYDVRGVVVDVSPDVRGRAARAVVPRGPSFVRCCVVVARCGRKGIFDVGAGGAIARSVVL